MREQIQAKVSKRQGRTFGVSKFAGEPDHPRKKILPTDINRVKYLLWYVKLKLCKMRILASK